MNYYIAQDRFGNYDLVHHGIKGQKWGVRRYQNEDGSWTSEGRKRYSDTIKGLNRLDRDIAKSKYQKAKANVKLSKALRKGKLDKIEKYKKITKDLDRAIAKGDRQTKDIISQMSKKGFTINATDTKRYAKAGNAAAAWLFLPGGLITYGIVQGVKEHRHGSEYAGVVSGKKYSIGDYDEKKRH